MTPVAAWNLYNQGNKALANCVAAMDEEERQAYDQLSDLSAPREDDGWEDIEDVAMDIDQALDGTNPVELELSHEGGEFYELVEHCIKSTSKVSFLIYKFTGPLLL